MNRVISTAEKELGYLEKKSNAKLDDKTANAGSGNYTKYWRDLKPSFQGQAWCGAFVNWCFEKSYGRDKAKKLLCTQGEWSYYTPTSADYFKKAGQWFSSPKPGDVVYFKNSERIHHKGLVIKSLGDEFETIEGNTSSGAEVIPNGGGVYRKRYSIKNGAVAGFGRPDYSIVQYAVGWNQDSKGWWYADTPSTYISRAWKDINHCRYYFNAEGYAVKGEQEIDGKIYLFCSAAGHPKECALMVSDKKGAHSILML